MKKLFFGFWILIFGFIAVAIAATGESYTISPEGLLPAGGSSEGSGYSVQHGIGDIIGITSSSAYASNAGFFASTVSYASHEAGVPRIENLLFDGRAIVSGDYVGADVTITALVTDDAEDIDTASSSVEIDSITYLFNNLTGSSSYDAATGILTYKPATGFMNGTHSFRITAYNTSGNAASGIIAFNVDSNGIKVIGGSALIYPNPYDPAGGNAEIAYRLNEDAEISVYIFNALGQKVWKRDYPSGTEGGHAGYNFVLWDGKTDFGETAASDIYFVRVVSGGSVIGRGKIAVIKN